ncbi:hypothetical protein ACNTMW_24130 [Planosporangium sp. 12N6]|uniref:hypothetical protein n=1 Tax=Planosporangium spinosum TaxID=3402278 RepID=UPI003CFB594A
MISTVSGPEKANLATAAGAHHVINYRVGDPAARIREIVPDGVDIVARWRSARTSPWTWPYRVHAARSRPTPTKADKRSS